MGIDLFSDIYFPMVRYKPKNTHSLPNRYRSASRQRAKRAPLSMYSSPQFLPRSNFNANSSYHSPSECSLCSTQCQQYLNQSIYQNQPYASSSPYKYDFNSEICSTNMMPKMQSHVARKIFINSDGIYDCNTFPRSRMHGNEFSKAFNDCRNNNSNYYKIGIPSEDQENTFEGHHISPLKCLAENNLLSLDSDNNAINEDLKRIKRDVMPINFDVQSLTIKEEFYVFSIYLAPPAIDDQINIVIR
ncbi:hypothetical protein ILUMI_03562, partial [Ignelater luminosus]